MKTRRISGKMMKAFLEGELKPILDAVKMDDTLDLELRGTFVNIYYRGGSLFKITEENDAYTIYFNSQYCLTGNKLLEEYPKVNILYPMSCH